MGLQFIETWIKTDPEKIKSRLREFFKNKNSPCVAPVSVAQLSHSHFLCIQDSAICVAAVVQAPGIIDKESCNLHYLILPRLKQVLS